MITILSTLIGFLSSMVPTLLSYLKDKKDKEHEIILMQKQIDAMNSGAGKIEAVNYFNNEMQYVYNHATAPQNSFAEKFAATVRPSITYLYFSAYLAVKVFCVTKLCTSGNIVSNIWGEEDQAIFGAITAFWFGDRAFRRK